MNTTNAELIDLGNGLVNDTALNITWMKNANLVKTACDAADGKEKSLWDAFALLQPNLINNSGITPEDICSDNGQLNWYEAEAWIGVLNRQNYLGYSGWRQPFTKQPDVSCSDQTSLNGDFPVQGSGYNCANEGSEINHLFYSTLANPNSLDNNCYDPSVSAQCFQNFGPFFIPQGTMIYWSGTNDIENASQAWSFETYSGFQTLNHKNFNIYVWPVLSGQAVLANEAPQ